jgi:hypothetical protein
VGLNLYRIPDRHIEPIKPGKPEIPWLPEHAEVEVFDMKTGIAD